MKSRRTSLAVGMPVLLRLALLAASLLDACCVAAEPHDYSHLGPGRGAWQVGKPEHFGMDSAQLEAAAKEVGTRAPHRYCLAVIKDGVIVHESYYSNTSSSVYESDSLGKTITAAMVSAAIEQGLVDLDVPIAQYGVTPGANWSVSGVDYFPEVTLRHLLAQASGYGTLKPGTKMTYDSDQYIQHISYAITAAAKKSGKARNALEFASSEFATALGIPDLYTYDGTGEDISAGGGQMVSCRDVARVGQLIINRGKWRDASGQPYQLGQAAYMDEMLQPAYPGTIDGYGFLTWLNTDMRAPIGDGRARSHCCGPRWLDAGSPITCDKGYCGMCCAAASGYNMSVPCSPELPVLPEVGPGKKESCSDRPHAGCARHSDPSEYVSSTMLGDSFPEADQFPSFPGRIGVAMGQFAKYLYVVPERNISIVTLGQSAGLSLSCDTAYGARSLAAAPLPHPPLARRTRTLPVQFHPPASLPHALLVCTPSVCSV